MKKGIYARINVHPIQQAIYDHLVSGNIDFSKDTLRSIAEKTGTKHPQQVKHHIMQLVKMGIIDIRGGNYYFKNSYVTP